MEKNERTEIEMGWRSGGSWSGDGTPGDEGGFTVRTPKKDGWLKRTLRKLLTGVGVAVWFVLLVLAMAGDDIVDELKAMQAERSASQQDDSRIMTMLCDQSGQREDGRTSARLAEPTPGLNYVEWFGPDAACEPHVTYTVLIDSDDLLSNLNRDVGDLADDLVRVTAQRDAYRQANEDLLRTVGVRRGAR